jgi:hypothetical protein
MKRITKSSKDKYFEEDTIYTEDFREDLVDSGEISAWEAAFMQGYDEAG